MPWFGWIVMLLIAVSGIAFLASRTTQGNNLPTWEYKIEDISDNGFTDRMNILGKQGWDLVQARRTDDSGTAQAGYEVILKRVK